MSNANVKSLVEGDGKLVVLPGDCLMRYDKNIIASTGTYIKNGYIYASLAGHMVAQEKYVGPDIPENEEEKAKFEMKPEYVKRVVRVEGPNSKRVPFPEPGTVVTAKILRCTPNFVKCSIHCIENHVLKQAYSGMIRVEDIRDTDRDKIKVTRCFKPGDIVLASVIAPGEGHQFLLTTAQPELGVVIATNDWGEPMIPISTSEVMCQRTFMKEPRKVARLT